MRWDDYKSSVGEEVWKQLQMACFTTNFPQLPKTLRKITQKFNANLCKLTFLLYGELAVFFYLITDYLNIVLNTL